jgi:hypothetical protein
VAFRHPSRSGLSRTGQDAELDAVLELVEAAGRIEQDDDEQGRLAMSLTPEGVRIDRRYAMLGQDGQDALMAGLLQSLVREATASTWRSWPCWPWR